MDIKITFLKYKWFLRKIANADVLPTVHYINIAPAITYTD